MILWDQCRSNFAPDGALRDIYILRTSIDDWNHLLKAVCDHFRPEYTVDGLSHPMPADAGEVFAIQESTTQLLRVEIGSINAACHFFTIDEIEFDIDPREINSQESLDQMLEFVRLIGDSVSKQVIVTYESDQQHPFISYDPIEKSMSRDK